MSWEENLQEYGRILGEEEEVLSIRETKKERKLWANFSRWGTFKNYFPKLSSFERIYLRELFFT